VLPGKEIHPIFVNFYYPCFNWIMEQTINKDPSSKPGMCIFIQQLAKTFFLHICYSKEIIVKNQ